MLHAEAAESFEAVVAAYVHYYSAEVEEKVAWHIRCGIVFWFVE